MVIVVAVGIYKYLVGYTPSLIIFIKVLGTIAAFTRMSQRPRAYYVDFYNGPG